LAAQVLLLAVAVAVEVVGPVAVVKCPLLLVPSWPPLLARVGRVAKEPLPLRLPRLKLLADVAAD
jgi:hypothetical protein